MTDAAYRGFEEAAKVEIVFLKTMSSKFLSDFSLVEKTSFGTYTECRREHICTRSEAYVIAQS